MNIIISYIINRLTTWYIKLTKTTKKFFFFFFKNKLNYTKIDLVEGQTFCKGMSGDFTRMICSVPNAYQPMTMRVH